MNWRIPLAHIADFSCMMSRILHFLLLLFVENLGLLYYLLCKLNRNKILVDFFLFQLEILALIIRVRWYRVWDIACALYFACNFLLSESIGSMLVIIVKRFFIIHRILLDIAQATECVVKDFRVCLIHRKHCNCSFARLHVLNRFHFLIKLARFFYSTLNILVI
jgi:hypothetical protein